MAAQMAVRIAQHQIAEWETSEPLQRAALRLIQIHAGPENAISRGKLAEILAVSDRKARATIEELRAKGEPICSTTEGGYWWPRSRDEFEIGVAQYRAHALRMTKAIAAMQMTIDQMFPEESPQGELF